MQQKKITFNQICKRINDLPDGEQVYVKKMYWQADWDLFDICSTDNLKRFVAEFQRLKKKEKEK